MDLLSLIIIALGLSADAFAVSVTDGMCSEKVTKKNAIITALTFGIFQGIMPLIGFALGKTFSDVICRYQHWIALFLLGAIGINMIVEAIKEQMHPDEICSTRNIFNAKNLILQGIATSIDALAVGVSFVAMKVNIFTTSLLIGIITFLCCTFGVHIGRKFGVLLGMRARLIGGILLIIIGVKIFIENTI